MGEVVASTNAGRKRHLRWILACILIAGLLIGLAYWLIGMYTAKPAINIGKGADVGSLVQALPRDQQEEVAKVNILIPAADMEWSFAKAVALAATDKQKEALEMYESLDKTGKAPYYVYIQYSSAAAEAKDHKLAADMLTKAIEILEADTSVKDTEKSILKRRLAGTLAAYKEEVK